MVKVQIKGNLLDLESPVYMDERKQEKFIDGMKTIFGDRIKITRIVENKKIITKKRTNKSKKFIFEDLMLLANGQLEQEQIADKLNKSKFAIQMKQGPFLMQLMTWAKKKNLSKLNQQDVNKFLREIGYGD